MAQLPPGEITWVQHGREEVLVANVDGQIHAMDNVCSHSGGPLAEGIFRGAIVRCPLHGWQYDVTTGCCTHIPDECLRLFKVVLEGGQIFVEIPE